MPLFKHILPFLLLMAPWAAEAADNDAECSREQVCGRLSQLDLHPIEGLWEFPANGTVIAIERDDPQVRSYRIYTVESSYLVLEPGKLLGYATPTAKRDIYQAKMQSIDSHGNPRKPGKSRQADFLLTLSDGDALVFKPIKKGLRINWDWWRLFPYMFRMRIDRVDETPPSLDGAVKLWPRPANVAPRHPRYL